MTYFSHFECREGGERFSGDAPLSGVCAPGDVLDACYDLERLGHDLSRDDIARGPASLWRYASLLPVAAADDAVTLGEGWTPLLPAPRLGKALGCADLFIKDEGRNPSGSFKDRGATVGATRLRELGVDTIVLNSSGNAGGSWALYAARAGLRCINLLPDDVLPAMLQQSVLAGAETVLLDGHWKEAGPMVKAAAERHGWFNNATLKEPYRLEGKKTMGYEICEQLGWQVPDVIVYPTGGALGAIAIFKAIEELKALGWIAAEPTPRLVVTQYAGCAPIVKAFEEGKDHAETWEDLDVLPGGLKSTTPPGDRAVLRILRETGGTAIAVGTEESLDAVAEMTAAEGIFPCPESATTLAGLKRALDDGRVGRDERIVLMCTGTGLKSIPNLPEPERRTVRPGDDLGAHIFLDEGRGR